MKLDPSYLAAFIALGFVAWVALRRGPESAGGITTEDGEGGALDLPGIWNQAEQVFASNDNFANPTNLSAEGLQRLMAREGFAAEPYADFKGNSIGFGHLIKPGERFTSITREEGAELLAADVAWAEAAVRSAVLVPINQAQFDALVSFAFNVGAGAFARSTLVRRINAYDQAAGDEFARWVYAGGVVNQGLVARRADEADQFNA